MYADIIVDISHENLDRVYQYKIPEHLSALVFVGVQVYIPFGMGNRKIKGYVIGITNKVNFDISRIKDIDSVVDKSLAIENKLIALAGFIKQNFGGTMNEALKELEAEGVLDQIVKNYIGDDTKGTCPYESPADVDYSNGTLTMATNAAFEPYEYYEGTEIVGIDAEMAKAICDKLGYELKIEDMEFDAIISAVQSGKADFGAAGMTVTEDRLTSIDFTDSYATSTQVVIVRK